MKWPYLNLQAFDVGMKGIVEDLADECRHRRSFDTGEGMKSKMDELIAHLETAQEQGKQMEQRIAELEEENQRLQDTIKAQISTIFDAKAETDRWKERAHKLDREVFALEERIKDFEAITGE